MYNGHATYVQFMAVKAIWSFIRVNLIENAIEKNLQVKDRLTEGF